MTQLVKVARLQLVNRSSFLYVPLIIVTGALALSIVIFMLIPSDGPKYAGGAAAAPLWHFAIVGGQALMATFPFSLALSVTRRDFHLGTFLTAAFTSAMLALIYTVIGVVEHLTGGWGNNGYFTFPGLGGEQPLLAFLTFFSGALLFFSIGYAGGAALKRWGALVLAAIAVSLAVLLSLGLVLVIRSGKLESIVSWFAGQGYLGLSLWSLLAVMLLAGGSFLLVRRMPA